MLFRLFLPFIAWITLLFLLTIRVYPDPTWEWLGITKYTLVQCILFAGFAHILMGILNKQLKYEKLRNQCFFITWLIGIVVVIGIESTRMVLHLNTFSLITNLIFDAIGLILGIGIFRLLYRGIC